MGAMAEAPHTLDYGPDEPTPALRAARMLILVLVYLVGMVSWLLWLGAAGYLFLRIFAPTHRMPSSV